jgi:hypothetical protein
MRSRKSPQDVLNGLFFNVATFGVMIRRLNNDFMASPVHFVESLLPVGQIPSILERKFAGDDAQHPSGRILLTSIER